MAKMIKESVEGAWFDKSVTSLSLTSGVCVTLTRSSREIFSLASRLSCSWRKTFQSILSSILAVFADEAHGISLAALGFWVLVWPLTTLPKGVKRFGVIGY